MTKVVGESTLLAKGVAEFVGTFFLVLTVGCNTFLVGSDWCVLSIASALMVVIYALGATSGANFNPAVSLAAGLAGKLEWKNVICYIPVQIVAGLLAAWIACLIVTTDNFKMPPLGGELLEMPSIPLENRYQWWQAGLAEMFYTLMLAFVFLNTATSKKHARKDQFYGIAIGFTVVAGGYGAGAISGGYFNPAIAFGLGCQGTNGEWSLYYAAFELLGGVLAALFFRICRMEEYSAREDPSRTEENKEHPLISKLTSEFIGVFMLVLTVGLNCVRPANVFAALSIGAALMCMTFSLGSVSGAHFNPAVTLAVMVSGREKISNAEAAMYIVVQVITGVVAAFTSALLSKGLTVPLRPAEAYADKWVNVIFAELLFTFLLAYVMLSVATVHNHLSQYFGMAIGFCVVVGGYAIGSISGASLNPAISFGLAAADTINYGGFWKCLVYSAAELAGGALAACVFFVTHANEYDDLEYYTDEEELEDSFKGLTAH